MPKIQNSIHAPLRRRNSILSLFMYSDKAVEIHTTYIIKATRSCSEISSSRRFQAPICRQPRTKTINPKPPINVAFHPAISSRPPAFFFVVVAGTGLVAVVVTTLTLCVLLPVLFNTTVSTLLITTSVVPQSPSCVHQYQAPKAHSPAPSSVR